MHGFVAARISHGKVFCTRVIFLDPNERVSVWHCHFDEHVVVLDVCIRGTIRSDECRWLLSQWLIELHSDRICIPQVSLDLKDVVTRDIWCDSVHSTSFWPDGKCFKTINCIVVVKHKVPFYLACTRVDQVKKPILCLPAVYYASCRYVQSHWINVVQVTRHWLGVVISAVYCLKVVVGARCRVHNFNRIDQ